MKKTITLLCCMAMVVSLASCGEPAPLTEGHALTACKRQAKIEAPKGFYYKLSNVDITIMMMELFALSSTMQRLISL